MHVTDTQNEKKRNLRVSEKECGHAKQEKWEFACRGKRRWTRKTRKKKICVSVKTECGHAKQEKKGICVLGKKNADTQNKKKGNLRVWEKEDGHAKQEKRKSACLGKRRRTRKMRKMEICVYMTGRRCMKCASRRQRRGSKESSRKRVPPCCIARDGTRVGRPLSRGGREADGALVTQPRLSQSDF
ncbi:MAG: hypothetical protein IJ791_10785 [Lachnospiraceae bacterium]|nr:hypothetical protein [Lachnospiraceae bacterium]